MFEEAMDRARDALYLGAAMQLSGNRELILENCRRIEEYSDAFMRLSSGELCVQIWGSDLRAYNFKGGGLVIRGRISQIELEERRGCSERTDQGQRPDKR